MQKWDYLRVCIEGGGNNGNLQSRPSKVYVIRDNGILEERKKENNDSDHAPVVSRLLKQLGDEGYELICSGSGAHNFEVVLYFKRPQND